MFLSILYALEVVIIFIPMLLSIAYFTIAERKTMGSMQRRLGPNIVGYYGLLQAFADALKLLLKEYVSPTQANVILFFLGPIITLIFSLLSYAIIPFSPGLALYDFNLGILYFLAISSLSTYGILLAGWSANSKYAFLGSLRSTAQLISYELVLSSSILIITMLVGNLNMTICIESQRAVYFFLPLLPIFIIFFIGAIAETNRAPFDLAEAESELVSGFMTEHAAVIFVFFFLAEYGSILLMCILTNIFFFGGYLLNINYLILLIVDNFLDTEKVLGLTLNYTINYIVIDLNFIANFIITNLNHITNFNLTKIDVSYYVQLDIIFYITCLLNVWDNIITNNLIMQGLIYGLIIGIKSSIFIFFFIWVRASFPRIRFDQLMSFCWTILLPLVFSFILLIPCLLYNLNIFPININLF